MPKDLPHILPDMLRPGLSLVFCGTAPSAISAARQAYYANPGNVFWKTLHEVGITPSRLPPADYPMLLEQGIGLTDLCKLASGQDADLPAHLLDRDSLRAKIEAFQPRLLAFTSKNAGQIFLNHKVEFGEQAERVGETRLFVLPSTSGLARSHWQAGPWVQLAAEYAQQKTRP